MVGIGHGDLGRHVYQLLLCVFVCTYMLSCVFVCICHRVCQSTVECGCAAQPQIGWTARHCHRFTVVTLKDTEAKAFNVIMKALL